jgi:hypothetical protein
MYLIPNVISFYAIVWCSEFRYEFHTEDTKNRIWDILTIDRILWLCVTEQFLPAHGEQSVLFSLADGVHIYIGRFNGLPSLFVGIIRLTIPIAMLILKFVGTHA